MAPAYQLQREIGGSKTLRRARVRDLGDGIEDGDHADRRGTGLGLRLWLATAKHSWREKIGCRG